MMNERTRRVNVRDEQIKFVNRLRVGKPSERTTKWVGWQMMNDELGVSGIY